MPGGLHERLERASHLVISGWCSEMGNEELKVIIPIPLFPW